MTNMQTRDLFISRVRSFAMDGFNNMPLSDWYDASSGVVSGFRARLVLIWRCSPYWRLRIFLRPVVGGHLAHLALQ
jgi:Domain of unknown function (DUF1793)